MLFDSLGTILSFSTRNGRLIETVKALIHFNLQLIPHSSISIKLHPVKTLKLVCIVALESK
jgi:hypothetical protein